jgi:hypothetical protein
MTILDLQQRLAALGFYRGTLDGLYGSGTRTALMTALASGPDTPITVDDVARAAATLSTTPAHVRTVRDVEAAGAGFANGLPKILFEGHIFSKLTGGRFDRTNPAVSYPKWDRTKYPATQQGRYEQLLTAVGLDVAAAFASASYGAFQILGENFRVCGFNSSFDFVLAQCQTEGAQLISFINFIRGNRLDDALRNGRWAEFARGYNGSAYKANQYDVKLAQAFAKEQALDHTQPPPPAPTPRLSGTCRITDKLNLRAAPGGDVLGIVDAGGFVNVVRDLGDWCEVNYAPGKNGYMLSQFLTKA